MTNSLNISFCLSRLRDGFFALSISSISCDRFRMELLHKRASRFGNKAADCRECDKSTRTKAEILAFLESHAIKQIRLAEKLSAV